jgi:hypothetical protein
MMNSCFAVAGCVLTGIVLCSAPTLSAQPAPTPAPLGIWLQDDTGPVIIYRRTYTFKPDGTYELVMTSRPKGSMNQTVVARETGVFRVNADRLVVAPASGPPRASNWIVEKDKYTGNLQLVLVLPDGRRDIYYPQ